MSPFYLLGGQVLGFVCVCVCVCVCVHAHVHAHLLGCVWLFVAPWTIAHQAPRSMGFPGKNTGVELPFPPPGDLPNPGIEPESPASHALAGGFLTTQPPGKPKFGVDTALISDLQSWWINTLTPSPLSWDNFKSVL